MSRRSSGCVTSSIRRPSNSPGCQPSIRASAGLVWVHCPAVWALERGDRKSDRRVLERDPEALLSVYAGELDVPQFRDIAAEGDEALDLLELVEDRSDREQHVDLGPILADVGPDTLLDGRLTAPAQTRWLPP